MSHMSTQHSHVTHVNTHSPCHTCQHTPHVTHVYTTLPMSHIPLVSDYENDPYSEGNPMKAICSRGDLQTKPSPGGCIDTKVMAMDGGLCIE